MSNFLNVNAWIWRSTTPIEVHVKQYGPESFMLRFSTEHDSVEVSMNRVTLVMLRDQISDVLFKEGDGDGGNCKENSEVKPATL